MKQSKNKPDRKKEIKKIILWTVITASALILSGIFIFIYYFLTLPSPFQLASQQVAQSTKIYDRTGTVLLYETNADQKRTVVSFDQIPDACKQATVAIEDQNFYTEPAFNVLGIIRAAFVDLVSGQFVQGGSTITQQLAKNAFLSSDKTITRKIKELVLAVKLGQQYSKDDLLSFYLNLIPYGSNLYGIESASEAYFNEPVKNLDLSQCAILASIPRAPTYYSPWGSHQSDLFARQHEVLSKMLDLKEITQKQYDAAVSEKISFSPPSSSIKAPHFVMAVLDYLTQKYGEDLVDNDGLKVITTLDWNLQQEAEKAVQDGVQRNTDLYQSYNGALVAQDATSGQILAMVGSKNYASSSLPVGCVPGKNCKFEGNFNVATQGLRQPGSSLKPFVYLDAFKQGYTPNTVVFDLPTEFVPNNPNCPPDNIDFNSTSTQCFHPQDFEGTFAGPVSLRDALAQSINVPAVKILYLVGINNVLNTLNDFGVTTLNDPSRYGLSLVLGGGEVKLIDLVEAYSVLAQNGIKHNQTMILSVTDGQGRVLESYSDNPTQIADPQDVEMVNNILSDADARKPLFQSSLPETVFPGYDVALKTGTTNDYRDAWSFGYTPYLVVGVWAGNNDNSPMQKNGSSILAAVPIWHEFMTEAIKNYPPQTFNRPSQIVADKPILNGDYLANNQIHNILYYVNPADPTGPTPTDPQNDPQFNNWEIPVLNWAKQNLPNFSQFNQASVFPNTTQNNNDLTVNIIQPTNGSFTNGNINVQAEIKSSQPIIKISIIFNGQTIKEFDGNFGNDYSLNYVFTPSNAGLQNLLKVQAQDSNGNQSENQVIIY
ncbi:MAG: transglycosylase domain-containing protein [Patescibacteria group bacterium]|nr:transglycosylase domain-containing protein [Patescibacteria group bacterium]